MLLPKTLMENVDIDGTILNSRMPRAPDEIQRMVQNYFGSTYLSNLYKELALLNVCGTLVKLEQELSRWMNVCIWRDLRRGELESR